MARKVLKRSDFNQIASNRSDLLREYVHTPEWGDYDTYVCVQSLTGTQRDRYEGEIIDQRGGGKAVFKFANARAKLVQACLIDEDTGELLFSPQEIDQLGERSALALDRVFTACQKLSGLRKEDIDTLTGDLKNGQNGSSGTA